MTCPPNAQNAPDSLDRARTGRLSYGLDARGRRVTQLDPIALHLLRRHDVIPADALRAIAEELDPEELKRRPRAFLLAPFWVLAWYAAFFGYFYLFERWRGWRPVLGVFAISYFLFPFGWAYFGFRKARRARHERIQRVMLAHLRCPHCGYDIRGLREAPEDGATVCPECGCAWRIDDTRVDEGGMGTAAATPVTTGAGGASADHHG
jgi:hypothetical protein